MTDSRLSPSEALAAADIAREAARLVARENGWCQHSLAEPRPEGGESNCLLGALGVAALSLTGNRWGAPAALWDEIRKRTGKWPVSWNNAPDRKQHEVVELLERVSKRFDREASRVQT
jgi:hypothetical protein